MKEKYLIFALIITFAFLATSCSNPNDANGGIQPFNGTIIYKDINVTSASGVNTISSVSTSVTATDGKCTIVAYSTSDVEYPTYQQMASALQTSLREGTFGAKEGGIVGNSYVTVKRESGEMDDPVLSKGGKFSLVVEGLKVSGEDRSLTVTFNVTKT